MSDQENPSAAQTYEDGLMSPEQRKQIKEIVWWLKGDLYERVPLADIPDDVNGREALVMRSPLKWTVILGVRRDGSGFVGEIRRPDGEPWAMTSFADIHWLEAKLP